MASTQEQGELFDLGPVTSDVVVINDRCVLRTRDGHRVVVVAGVAFLHYAVGDRMAEAHAIVNLVESGWATQVEAAEAFGCTTRTVRRNLGRFEAGGLSALGRHRGFPRGVVRVGSRRDALVSRLKGEGHSNRAIAERLHITENAVRKQLRRLGWRERHSDLSTTQIYASLVDSRRRESVFALRFKRPQDGSGVPPGDGGGAVKEPRLAYAS